MPVFLFGENGRLKISLPFVKFYDRSFHLFGSGPYLGVNCMKKVTRVVERAYLIASIMNNNFSNLPLQVVVLLVLLVCTGLGVRAQNIITVAGTGYAGFNGDGKIATLAEIDGQTGAAIDQEGNVYISDFNSNRIRKVAPGGTITTVAGTGTPGFAGDGGPATAAKIFGPMGIALDKSGNIYFADNYNQRIRKINMASGIISTIAGSGESGFAGNGAPATLAKFQSPEGIAVDAAGNVYVTDCDNNCIRKIGTNGIITAYAGNAIGKGTGLGNYSGDGKSALNAELNHPKGLTVDAQGNVYFADCFNHRIRKVNTSGIITTVAGEGNADYNGDGRAATSASLNYPVDVTTDAAGNLFISDHANHRVRMVNKQGTISTVAGNGQLGFGGDGELATLAKLANPSFVEIGSNGNLYIGDNDNSRVRMVIFSTATSVTNHAAPIMRSPKAASHIATN